MRLAREQHEHRTVGIEKDLPQPAEILEQQGCPLVGGEAAREAQGQDVRVARIGKPQQPLEMRLAAVVAVVLRRDSVPHEEQHLRLQGLAHAPEHVIGNAADRFPELLVAQAVRPFKAEVAVENLLPLLGEKARHVHTIGDVVDGIFLCLDLRPEHGQHLRAHLAVDSRHAVVIARPADRQRGHVKVMTVRVAAESQKLLPRHFHVWIEGLEVPQHHVVGEVIVSGGHRGMRGENRVRRHGFECGGEIEAERRYLVADPLQDLERRVSLVDVPHRGFDTERAQRAHAAHAKNDLLLDAHGAIAAIEAVSNIPVGRRVLVEVGVEKVQVNEAAAGLPDLAHDPASRQLDLDAHVGAVRSQDGAYRHVVEIGVEVRRVLVAFEIDGLDEIALLVEQSHRDEGQSHVARGLAVVAGEDAQAARVNRKTLVKSELGAEVRDEVTLPQPLGTVLPQRLVVIGVVVREHPVEVAEINRIVGCLAQAPLVHTLQEGFRIVADRIPEPWVQASEERPGGTVPAIPQVVGDLV